MIPIETRWRKTYVMGNTTRTAGITTHTTHTTHTLSYSIIMRVPTHMHVYIHTHIHTHKHTHTICMRLYTYNYILTIRSIVIIHAWFAIHLNQRAPAIIEIIHLPVVEAHLSFTTLVFLSFNKAPHTEMLIMSQCIVPHGSKDKTSRLRDPKNVDHFHRFGTHFWSLAIWTADPTAYIFLQGHCTSVHGNPKNDRRDARLFNYQPVILKVVQRCKLCRFWTPKPGIQPMSEQATNQKKAESRFTRLDEEFTHRLSQPRSCSCSEQTSW